MVEWSLVIVFHDVFVFLSSLTYCLGFPIYSSSWIMRDNTHCVPIEVQFKETENKSKFIVLIYFLFFQLSFPNFSLSSDNSSIIVHVPSYLQYDTYLRVYSTKSPNNFLHLKKKILIKFIH